MCEIERGCHLGWGGAGLKKNTEVHLQRKWKETRKMNTVLQHKETALHYLTSLGEENNGNKQQTIQLLLLQPPSPRRPPLLISNSPATVCCSSSWWLLWLPGVTRLPKQWAVLSLQICSRTKQRSQNGRKRPIGSLHTSTRFPFLCSNTCDVDWVQRRGQKLQGLCQP